MPPSEPKRRGRPPKPKLPARYAPGNVNRLYTTLQALVVQYRYWLKKGGVGVPKKTTDPAYFEAMDLIEELAEEI